MIFTVQEWRFTSVARNRQHIVAQVSVFVDAAACAGFVARRRGLRLHLKPVNIHYIARPDLDCESHRGGLLRLRLTVQAIRVHSDVTARRAVWLPIINRTLVAVAART